MRTKVSFGSYNSRFQFKPPVLTIKHKLMKQAQILPSINLIARAKLEPLASPDSRTNTIPVDVLFAFNNDINDNVFITYNFGTSTWFRDLIFRIESGVEVNDKLSFFIEYLAQYYHNDMPDQDINAGILYLLSSRLQIDFAAGKSLVREKNMFFTTGLSYRFKDETDD